MLIVAEEGSLHLEGCTRADCDDTQPAARRQWQLSFDNAGD